MKKYIFRGLAMSLMLVASASANAQIDILNNIKNAVTTTTAKTKSSITSALTSVVGTSKVTAQELVGTWNYASPAVVFESNNLFKQAGGAVAASALEKKLQTYLTGYGITPGKMSITFKNDNHFSCVSGDNTVSGTYKLSGTSLTLSYSDDSKNIASVTAYASLKDKKLQICFTSTKLLTFLTAVGTETGDATVAALSKFASTYNGMQMGMKFTKK